MKTLEIRQQTIAKLRQPAGISVRRRSSHRHVRQDATQQIKLTRAHLTIHQLCAVRIRNQRHQTISSVDWFNKRRPAVVAALLQQVDRREWLRLTFELSGLLS